MTAAPAPSAAGDADVGAMLRDSLREFCARNPGAGRTRRLRGTEPGHDPAVWTAMAEAGWTGMALPEELGGMGLGLAELCIVAEELAADLAPEPFGPAAVAALAIARGDNAALRGRLLPGIIAGGLLPALAWQEWPNTLEALDPETRLEPIGNGRLALSGTKRFVPAAAGAGGFAVTAATLRGAVLVWVAAGTPGLSRQADLAVDGSMLSTIRFDGVELGEDAILASPATAATLLPRLIDEAATIAAAELLGIMRAAFARTRDHVGQRKQFGRPIGSFQVLQHRLVDLWMEGELLRACVEEAALACAGADAAQRALAVSAAKARAAAAGPVAGRQSIQLHGAIGYADEHDIGLYLKRAIVKSGWMGGAPVHRRRYAALSGLGRQAGTGED